MIWLFAADLASLIDILTWVSMTLDILPSISTFRIALRMNAAKPTATVIPINIFICRVRPRRLSRRPFWLDDLPEWDDLLERDDLPEWDDLSEWEALSERADPSLPDEDLPGLGLADLALAEVLCEGRELRREDELPVAPRAGCAFGLLMGREELIVRASPERIHESRHRNMYPSYLEFETLSGGLSRRMENVDILLRNSSEEAGLQAGRAAADDLFQLEVAGPCSGTQSGAANHHSSENHRA